MLDCLLIGFGGGLGGNFLQLNLCGTPDTAAKSAYTHAHTHTLVGKAQICLLFYCVCIKKTTKKQPCVYCISSRILKKYGISVNKSPFTHDVNFTVLTVSDVYSNTKTNYLHPFLV